MTNTTLRITDPAIEKVIAEVLCSQALADHLGDVRDAETSLWRLLGADPRDFPEDYTSSWDVTYYRLLKLGLLPAEFCESEDVDIVEDKVE